LLRWQLFFPLRIERMIGRIIELSDQVSERRMPMSDNLKGFATKAVHWGHTPDQDTKSRAVPLYQTSSFTFDSTQHAADLFGLRQFGNIYTRIMNPTTEVLEKRVAELEGGVGALAVASGQAAETLTLLTLAQAGDEIVASAELYGGTVSLFSHTLKRLGITVRFVSPHDMDAWEGAVTPQTKAFFVETIGNPKLDIIDLDAIAAIGHRHGIPLVVDNTVTTPYCSPGLSTTEQPLSSTRPPNSSAATAPPSAASSWMGERSTGPASGRFPVLSNPNPPITA
jgi:O-acetylhomoserine/O-acetylserine sulfhydrylase-like pyridoxal-dependent enzyme